MNSSLGYLNYILLSNNESSTVWPSKCNLVLIVLPGTSLVNCTFASIPIWCHRLVSIWWCKLLPLFAVIDWSSICCHKLVPHLTSQVVPASNLPIIGSFSSLLLLQSSVGSRRLFLNYIYFPYYLSTLLIKWVLVKARCGFFLLPGSPT